MPRVENLQVFLPQRDHTRHDLLARRLRAAVNQAAGEQEIGVRYTAAERPAARHHYPTVDWLRLAAWRPHTGGHHLLDAEQLVAALGRQIGGQQTARDRDRHAPPGRRVAAGDLLRAPQCHCRRELQAAYLERCTTTQQAGVAQRRDQRVGELPSEFGLRGQLRRQGRHGPRDHRDLVRVAQLRLQSSLGHGNRT